MTRARWISFGGVLTALVAVTAWLLTVTWDTRDEIPQSSFLPSDEGDPFLLPGAHDATDTVCTADVPCRWAVDSVTATVMMFDDKSDATAAATRLPDSRQSNWIVVRFARDALDSGQKEDLMDSVNGLYTSD